MNNKGEAIIHLISTITIITILVVVLLALFFNFDSAVEVRKREFVNQWREIT